MKRADIKSIAECAAKAKVTLLNVELGSKHYKVQVLGKKSGTVFVSVSPSDKLRAYKNVVTDMRKACNV